MSLAWCRCLNFQRNRSKVLPQAVTVPLPRPAPQNCRFRDYGVHGGYSPSESSENPDMPRLSRPNPRGFAVPGSGICWLRHGVAQRAITPVVWPTFEFVGPIQVPSLAAGWCTSQDRSAIPIAGRVETLAAEHPHILRSVGLESCTPQPSAGNPAANTHSALRPDYCPPHVRNGVQAMRNSRTTDLM